MGEVKAPDERLKRIRIDIVRLELPVEEAEKILIEYFDLPETSAVSYVRDAQGKIIELVFQSRKEIKC